MAQAIAFASGKFAPLQAELLRSAIVMGCALALICARQPLPYLNL